MYKIYKISSIHRLLDNFYTICIEDKAIIFPKGYGSLEDDILRFNTLNDIFRDNSSVGGAAESIAYYLEGRLDELYRTYGYKISTLDITDVIFSYSIELIQTFDNIDQFNNFPNTHPEYFY